MTYSSKEIANLTNKLHKNVLRDIRQVYGKIGQDCVQITNGVYLIPYDVLVVLFYKYSLNIGYKLMMGTLEFKDISIEGVSRITSDYLYVIREGFHYKIGVTGDVEKRIKTLQTANASELHLHKVVKFEKGRAFKVERFLHVLLKDYRVRGEWFNPPHGKMDYILDLIKYLK